VTTQLQLINIIIITIIIIITSICQMCLFWEPWFIESDYKQIEAEGGKIIS